MLINLQQWSNKTLHKVRFFSLIINPRSIICIYFMIDATIGQEKSNPLQRLAIRARQMLGMDPAESRVLKKPEIALSSVWVFTFRHLRFQFFLVAVIDHLMTVLSLNVTVPMKSNAKEKDGNYPTIYARRVGSLSVTSMIECTNVQVNSARKRLS